MTKHSLAFRTAALLSAGGLMAGYVIFQASGGEGKLLPGSKSKAVYAGPTSGPATQPAPGPIFHGSKSLIVFDGSQKGSTGVTSVSVLQATTLPVLMPGSKSGILINPTTLQGLTLNPSGTATLNVTNGGTTLAIPATKPATQPATPPAK